MTELDYRLMKLTAAWSALNNLDDIAIFYGAEACALEDAKAAIGRMIDVDVIAQYVQDNQEEKV